MPVSVWKQYRLNESASSISMPDERSSGDIWDAMACTLLVFCVRAQTKTKAIVGSPVKRSRQHEIVVVLVTHRSTLGKVAAENQAAGLVDDHQAREHRF